MDILSLDPAKIQPMQLRIAVAGSAGARFDTLLGESRARVEPDDLGSTAEPDRREDAPERNEGTEPVPEPSRAERDEGREPQRDARGEQRAPDDDGHEPGEPRPQLAATRRDGAAESTDAARLIATAQANPATSAAASEHGANSGVAPIQRTPAPEQGPRSGQSPSLHGPGPQGTEPAKPSGPQGKLSALRFVANTTPPVAPPQGALGALAALAAQNVTSGTAASRTGAQGDSLGKTSAQNPATAMANAEAASSAEANSNEAARKIAVRSKSHAAMQGAAAAQTPRAAGVAPAGSPAFAPAGAAAAAGSTFAGNVGLQTLGQPGFAISGLGLTALPGADHVAPSPRPAAGLPLTTEQVAVQIHKAANAGQDKINIRLYPADLGRVEVRLEWADDGALRAVISAERSETLDLLQRDSRALDRALQEAGLKTDSGSLSFDLRGHAEKRDDSAQSATSTVELSGQTATNDDGIEADADASRSRRVHDGILDLSV